MDPSVVPSETFTLKTYSYKNEKATQSTTATLQIRITHKNLVHLQTHNSVVGGGLTFVHEAVVSPEVVISDRCAMPPHIIALPPMRRRSILKALASVSIDGSLCECLAPSIEKYVVQEAERFGYKGFGVVAELEVTKAYDHRHDMAEITPSNLLRRRRVATKVDVYDHEMAYSTMAAPDDHPKKIV